jgi:uncharacterized protein YecE (DUF72 family)
MIPVYSSMGHESIYMGTSGFSFDDWKGSFYPQKLAKGRMLDYYVSQFGAVEINSTYYAIPAAKTFEGMVNRTPPDFLFMVKTHQSATHQRHEIMSETPKYLEAIKPLVESGKLRGLLLQFPWSFVRNETNLGHLKQCRELFRNLPIFVEFRHASWVKPELFDWLKTQDMGYVSVDEPQLAQMVPPVVEVTNGIGYVRFHGRNAEKWYGGDSHLRYDYLYSDEELRSWVGKVNQIREKAKELYLFFNNCHLGQAPTNARQMMRLLDMKPPKLVSDGFI